MWLSGRGIREGGVMRRGRVVGWRFGGFKADGKKSGVYVSERGGLGGEGGKAMRRLGLYDDESSRHAGSCLCLQAFFFDSCDRTHLSGHIFQLLFRPKVLRYQQLLARSSRQLSVFHKQFLAAPTCGLMRSLVHSLSLPKVYTCSISSPFLLALRTPDYHPLKPSHGAA